MMNYHEDVTTFSQYCMDLIELTEYFEQPLFLKLDSSSVLCCVQWS